MKFILAGDSRVSIVMRKTTSGKSNNELFIEGIAISPPTWAGWSTDNIVTFLKQLDECPTIEKLGVNGKTWKSTP